MAINDAKSQSLMRLQSQSSFYCQVRGLGWKAEHFSRRRYGGGYGDVVCSHEGSVLLF